MLEGGGVVDHPVDVRAVERVPQQRGGVRGECGDADRADDLEPGGRGSDEVQLEGAGELLALGLDEGQGGVEDEEAVALVGGPGGGVGVEDLEVVLQEVHLAHEGADERDDGGEHGVLRQHRQAQPPRGLQVRHEDGVAHQQLLPGALQRRAAVAQRLPVQRGEVPDEDAQVLQLLLHLEEPVVRRGLQRQGEGEAVHREHRAAARGGGLGVDVLGGGDLVDVGDAAAALGAAQVVVLLGLGGVDLALGAVRGGGG